MGIHQDREVRGLVERILNPSQDWGAEGVHDIEDHNSHGLASLAAQVASELIGAIAEIPCSLLDAPFGLWRNVTGERSIIEDNGNGGNRKAALSGHVPNGDGRSFGVIQPQLLPVDVIVL